MNASIRAASLETVEDVADQIDIWMGGDSSREFKVRKTILGSVATLFEGGRAVSCGRGNGCADALAHALEGLR